MLETASNKFLSFQPTEESLFGKMFKVFYKTRFSGFSDSVKELIVRLFKIHGPDIKSFKIIWKAEVIFEEINTMINA